MTNQPDHTNELEEQVWAILDDHHCIVTDDLGKAATQSIKQLIDKVVNDAVQDALATSKDVKQPSVSKPLTLDRLKDLIGGNLRKNEPDYGRRQFVMGYNQAKDEIRERILTW